MIPLTLFDVEKYDEHDAVKAAVQLAIARSSMVFRFLPFLGVPDMQFDTSYDKEDAEGSYRAINEQLTQGNEDVDQLKFTTAIFGDKASVDRQIIKTKGLGAFDKKMNQKAFGLAVTYNNAFIKGDKTLDPRQFNGLQKIVTQQCPASQTLVSGGAGNNGAALSLVLLDEAIDNVRGANIIFCSANLARKFWAAGRDQNVAGFVNYQPNDSNPVGMGLGAAITFYNGIPIVPIKGAFNRDNILPYEETQGSNNETTSLYVGNIGSDGLYGAQVGGIDANIFGYLPDSVFYAGDMEWNAGLGIDHPLAITRVKGITDAAIVA